MSQEQIKKIKYDHPIGPIQKQHKSFCNTNFLTNNINTTENIDLVNFNNNNNILNNKIIKFDTINKTNNNSNKLSFEELYCTGNANMEPGILLQHEVDPSIPINYWIKNGVLTKDSFIYPKDPKTGKSLGAWPSNYANIETQLTNYITYDYGFIWPVTPQNSEYHYVYEHNGIDIMADAGTPIYSPIEGTLIYSEWGHTQNKRTHETPYTVSIKLDEAIKIDGKNIDTVFLTHMSGTRYNQEHSQNGLRIEKGELLGFVGNGAGNPNDGTINWAPHLHMTLYDSSAGFNNGSLSTATMEQIYNISPGAKRNAGE